MAEQKPTPPPDTSKGKLFALQNSLYAQLERLNNPSLDGDRLKEEINRAKAVTNVAREMILNGKLALDVQIAVKNRTIDSLPTLLEIEHKK